MKPLNELNHDYLKIALGAVRAPHGHGPKVMADAAQESGDTSSIREHILRNGVPEHLVATRGREGAPQANGVAFPDEQPIVRQYSGVPAHTWTLHGDEPHLTHEQGPESVEIMRADAVHNRQDQRWVARYTLRLGKHGHLRLVAPVTPEQIGEWGEHLDRPDWVALADRISSPGMLAGTLGSPDYADAHAHDQPQRLALRLSPGVPHGQPFGGGGAIHEHRILDEAGADQGFIRVQPLYDGRNLHIHLIGRRDDAPASDANTLGTSRVRELAGALLEHYPQAQFIQGHRGTAVGSGHRGTVSGKPPLVVAPIRRKLARQVYQAPGATGAISNGLFAKPGQFMGKARERIRTVAAALRGKATPLARADQGNYTALVHGITENPNDPLARLVFADHQEEHGLGSHVIRAHVADTRRGLSDVRERQRDYGTHGHRDASDMVAVDPDGSVHASNGEDYPTFLAAHPEAPLVQAYASKRPGRRGIVLATLHHTRDPGNPAHTTPQPVQTDFSPDGMVEYEHAVSEWRAAQPKRIVHIAHAKTAEELRALLSDFPLEARQTLLREWAENGTLKKRLAGKGSGKYQLARGDASTAANALTNHPGGSVPYDQPLTLGELKGIEDLHELPKTRRLSGKVKQPAGATGDQHPYSASIDDALQFLGHLSRSAIGPGKLKATLANPKVSDAVKHLHLMTNIFRDYGDAPVGDWYGADIGVMDRLLNHRFRFGTEDQSGQLAGKGAPHEHHPGLVLFKTLVGATSPSQNPVDNLRSAVKMWDAGVKRNPHDPVSSIPLFQEDALKEWMDHAAALNGLEHLPNPAPDSKGKAEWYAKYILPHAEALGVGKGHVGYSALQHQIYDNGVWYTDHKGQKNPAAPEPHETTAKLLDAPLPATDAGGAVRPKGWARYGQIAAIGIKRLQKLVDSFRKPHEPPEAAYREAAKWLFEYHDPKDFPAADRKRIYSDSPYESHERVPGFFLFGPKIGAFISNLHANDPATRLTHGEPFTHDTWMQRALLRHLGLLTDDANSKKISSKQRKIFRAVIKKISDKVGITPAELQAELWYHEQGLLRRVGVPKHMIPSLSYRGAAESLLGEGSPQKLARGLHESLTKTLGGKSWKRHSKRVAIQKHSTGSISVMMHGKKMITAHADGTVQKHTGKFYHTHSEAPAKLARPINAVHPGESAHHALNRLLDMRDSVRHGRTAEIAREDNGDISVFLHGHQIVTAHANGQVTLDHHGYMTPTTRRFMEGFSGHPVSFAGGGFTVAGQPYTNGTRFPPEQAPPEHTWTTVPHTDPELRDWVGQIRPDTRDTLLDHTAAAVLADRLEERGDWRHTLMRNSAQFGGLPRGGRTADPYTKANGETAWAETNALPAPPPAHGGSRRVQHEHGRPGTAYSVVYPESTGGGRVVVSSAHRTGGAGSREALIHSVLDAEQYALLRRQAATAGVHFPEAPK